MQFSLSFSRLQLVKSLPFYVYFTLAFKRYLSEQSLSIYYIHRRTGRGGEGGCSPPVPVLKNFGQNAYDSGKSTWDKFFIESSFYNTTKWSILKRLNGSVCCRSLDAGICCSFAPNFLANSQKAV